MTSNPPILHCPGEWSEAWARADSRYWRQMAINRGECPECGERNGKHEDGCKEAPMKEQDDEDDD